MLDVKCNCSDYNQKIIDHICLSFEEEKLSSEKELGNYVLGDVSVTETVTENTFLDDIRNITKNPYEILRITCPKDESTFHLPFF